MPAYKVSTLTGLDQPLGEPVYIGTTPVGGITFRDINSDGTKDLIAFHDDGTVGTRLERGDGSVLDVGDLLSVSNAREGMIRSGDFVGDGYSDIVYVDNDDVLRLVTHTQE